MIAEPVYPGTVLVVGAEGDVREASAGLEAPIAGDHAVGRPLHQVLGLDDASDEAGALQLWLACVDQVTVEMWQLARRDPPAALPALATRPALALDYGPILRDGVVTGVAVFARVTAERPRATAAMRAVEIPAEPVAPKFVDAFARSAGDLLHQCDAALHRISGDREARAAVDRLFRAIHTLKGEAHAAALHDVRDVAHAAEDLLSELRALDRPVRADELDRMVAAVASLRSAVAAVIAPTTANDDAMTGFYGQARPLIARLHHTLERWVMRPRTHRYAQELDRLARRLVEQAKRAGLRGFGQRAGLLAAVIHGSLGTNRPQRSVLALAEQRLDELEACLGLYQQLHLEVASNEAASELVGALAEWGHHAGRAVIAEPVLAELATWFRGNGVLALARAIEVGGDRHAALVGDLLGDAAAMFAPAASDAEVASTEALDALSDALAANALLAARPDTAELGARIGAALSRIDAALTRVSLDDLAARITHTAHGLAGELGKQVSVDVDAVGVTVAPSVHRVLSEILVHAVRNALDHGIETPGDRTALGKPAAGSIKIRVDVDAEWVVVDIKDDGRGIDVEDIRRRAVERSVMTPAAAAAALPEDLLELLFLPGFSTAGAVTWLSGRGVGMDVIRSATHDLGGRTRLTTWPGKGTCVRIDVPQRPPARP